MFQPPKPRYTICFYIFYGYISSDLCWLCQMMATKESEGPFPWATEKSSSSTPAKPISDRKHDDPTMVESKPMERKRKHTSMLETPSPKLERFLAECAAAPCISVNLCDLNASAGVALRHAIRTLEHLFQKQEPLIFKIGFTHSPVWRWSNNIYGYCKDKANWSNMIVFYCAEEPHGPAMMEAALIEKYGSTFAIYGTFVVYTKHQKSGSNISFFWIEQKNKLRQTRM